MISFITEKQYHVGKYKNSKQYAVQGNLPDEFRAIKDEYASRIKVIGRKILEGRKDKGPNYALGSGNSFLASRLSVKI